MDDARMLHGTAIGGPRHGVKLSAGPNWNGVVRKGSEAMEAYPGRYIFDFRAGIWEWHPQK